jgi:hypothetical protein
MAELCWSDKHDDGELDERIMGFHEQLRSRFPDYPPYPRDSPWMSMPPGTGVDHVIMYLSFSHHGDVALEAIMELATEYRLVVRDPQSEETPIC